MQKAEAQPANVQNQAAVKQKAAAESPQTEEVSQLEAMIESRPQAGKLSGLATMMNASPTMAAQRKLNDMIANSSQQKAQRKLIDGIHNSPRQIAQKKFADGINNSPAMVTQRKEIDSLFGTAQRMGGEETLQPKSASASSTQLDQQPVGKPNNTGLPDNLKSGIENLSGMSMDGVKVHYNSSQPAQLNALAYAQGTDIHVAPGQEKHLPHEAWHVVQQAQGRVRPTMQMKDRVPINDDAGLEREADLMGGKALGTAQLVGQKNIGELTMTPHEIVQKTLSVVSIEPDGEGSLVVWPDGVHMFEDLLRALKQEYMDLEDDDDDLARVTQILKEWIQDEEDHTFQDFDALGEALGITNPEAEELENEQRDFDLMRTQYTPVVKEAASEAIKMIDSGINATRVSEWGMREGLDGIKTYLSKSEDFLTSFEVKQLGPGVLGSSMPGSGKISLSSWIVGDGIEQLPGILIHEAAHAVLSAEDIAYEFNAAEFIALSPAQHKKNADSYRVCIHE